MFDRGSYPRRWPTLMTVTDYHTHGNAEKFDSRGIMYQDVESSLFKKSKSLLHKRPCQVCKICATRAQHVMLRVTANLILS